MTISPSHEASEVYLIRLGPPAKGDTIHTNSCRHATATVGQALRWAWADRIGFANIDWDALRRRHGIRPCRRCHPEQLACSDGRCVDCGRPQGADDTDWFGGSHCDAADDFAGEDFDDAD